MTHIIRDMENHSRMVQMHRTACLNPSPTTPRTSVRFTVNTIDLIQA